MLGISKRFAKSEFQTFEPNSEIRAVNERTIEHFQTSSLHYTLRFQRYCLDKILKVKFTMARSKVKSRSHHDVAHLQPPTNVPVTYQHPTPYAFRDIAETRFYRSRSLQQGQRLNKVTPWRCTPTPPNQCPYQISASYTLRFPRCSPDKIL